MQYTNSNANPQGSTSTNTERRLQVVANNRKKSKVNADACGYTPQVRDAVINLIYSHTIHPRSFRQIAELLQVRESVVSAIVKRYTRPVMAPVGRAA